MSEPIPPPWTLYMIRTVQNSLYTGITTNIQRRFLEHQSSGPKAAKALKGKGPLVLEFQHTVGTRSQALKLEYKIKQLSKHKKERLIGQPELLKNWFTELESPS